MAAAEVVIYSAPEGAPVAEKFQVSLDGKNVPVYLGSPKRFYGFTQFDVSGAVEVRITTSFRVSNPRLLPKGLGIEPTVRGNTVSFMLGSPGQITFLPDGSRFENALHIFANPLEKNPPRKGEQGVLYYGPGIHTADVVVGDNQTLYLAGGAILKGAVTVTGHNSKVLGRGMIDGSDWGHFARNDVPLRILGSNVEVEGIIVRLSWRAGVSVRNTSGVRISNVKVCASRFENDDGLTVTNADNVRAVGCFIRTDDDCIALKGLAKDRRDVFACSFEKCQLWCDRARIILIGHETMVNHMRDIVFRDIDILRYSMSPFLIEPGELGTAGPNVLFEDIRVEGLGDSTQALIQIQPVINRWMQLKKPGWVDGVTLRDIQFTGKHNGPWALIKGYDHEFTTSNVTLERVTVNGESLKSDSPGVTVGPHANNITFR
ncbi:MAG: glycosyl hydrolase family 28 protein [Thermogutta sp.]